MSHKIYLEDEVIECETFSELYVLLEFNYYYGIQIKVDPDLITLEQYITIINSNPYIDDFQVPEEVKTAHDLDEYVDAVTALSNIYEKHIQFKDK